MRLRPIQDSDYEYLASLKNDLRTQGWNQRLPPNYTAERIRERFKKTNDKPNSAILAIETSDGKLCGNINYEERPARLSATFGIVIGTEYWGKGYAKEAQEILLEFLFVERSVSVVRLWTQTGFPWAQKAAERLGFQVSCRFRENSTIEGKVVDCLMMDMTREEYFKKRNRRDPLPDRQIKD